MPSQVPPPSGVHPRPSTEGEAGGREEPQSITQQPDRPKEGEEDFNSSLGPISLVGTLLIKLIDTYFTGEFQLNQIDACSIWFSSIGGLRKY